MNNPPGVSEHIRNIVVDILLTIVTCGLYNIYVQYKQMQAVNLMLKYQKYSFSHWAILSLVTCGIYHFYHEYIKNEDIRKTVGADSGQTVIVLGILLFGLTPVADAIQQNLINEYFSTRPPTPPTNQGIYS